MSFRVSSPRPPGPAASCCAGHSGRPSWPATRGTTSARSRSCRAARNGDCSAPGGTHLPRVPGSRFHPRYLNAVTKAGIGRNGVLSVNLPWSHQRWLVRFARTAAPDVVGTPTPVRRPGARSTAIPGTRYLYVTSTDVAWQAARWYLGRIRARDARRCAAARPPPDFQEIRWIETLISRQEQAWECYFEVHGIDAHRIEYEALAGRPGGDGAGNSRLAGTARFTRAKMERKAARRAAYPKRWNGCPATWPQRDRLSAAIGIRQERR